MTTSSDRTSPLARLARTVRRHVGVVPDRTLSRRIEGIAPRIGGVEPIVSVCPYCAVGCSQLVYAKGGQLLHVEGNPASPINAGTLCPKGAATYQLAVNPLRLTRVKYRAPGADRWEEKPLDWAMERIARLVKEARDASFERWDEAGVKVNRTMTIAHLGGATLDNEENYLIKKLFAGLGMVWIENQARV